MAFTALVAHELILVHSSLTLEAHQAKILPRGSVWQISAFRGDRLTIAFSMENLSVLSHLTSKVSHHHWRGAGCAEDTHGGTQSND